MRLRETEIHDYARQLLEAHGGKAIAESAKRASECEDRGKSDEAESWRKVEAALKLMRGPNQA